ncbi:hypothetical protein [Capnocytophaga canimorsus]|uniref:hypothetical protein n=1 Tax=Capnocytophaga canimorsus TaxID=28188 RepID=UPI000589A96E|nr:hypothetical protein [Capnocytophaga canimorsus]CEN45035.1 conserved hypothetical protein [Capnocytophaga canimorsus]VEJ18279.1 Uncharacterised protein [Capnocytophaga canimorsus]
MRWSFREPKRSVFSGYKVFQKKYDPVGCGDFFENQRLDLVAALQTQKYLCSRERIPISGDYFINKTGENPINRRTYHH